VHVVLQSIPEKTQTNTENINICLRISPDKTSSGGCNSRLVTVQTVILSTWFNIGERTFWGPPGTLEGFGGAQGSPI